MSNEGNEKKLAEALESFLESGQLRQAIASSTMAGYSGGWYAVELFPDGSHRVLWDGRIGNLYHSPGAIIQIPALPDDVDEMNSEEWQEALDFYSDVYAQELRETLQCALGREK